jgi:hypothetical protein
MQFMQFFPIRSSRINHAFVVLLLVLMSPACKAEIDVPNRVIDGWDSKTSYYSVLSTSSWSRLLGLTDLSRIEVYAQTKLHAQVAWGSALFKLDVDCKRGAIKIAGVDYYQSTYGRGEKFPPGLYLHDPDVNFGRLPRPLEAKAFFQACKHRKSN